MAGVGGGEEVELGWRLEVGERLWPRRWPRGGVGVGERRWRGGVEVGERRWRWGRGDGGVGWRWGRGDGGGGEEMEGWGGGGVGGGGSYRYQSSLSIA